MRLKIIITIFLVGILNTACKKFLEEKPDRSLVIPTSIKDLQAMLDNTSIFNANYSWAAEIGSDDYYLTTADWQARTPSERNAYIWSAESFNDATVTWALPYTIVYNSNVVLEELTKINRSVDPLAHDNIKGQALFFRSFAFHNLLQAFAKPYSVDSADIHLGIALRLDPDFNKQTTRATVEECYQQIIDDTKTIIQLLPAQQLFKTRPSRSAAYALLARTYLSMSDYSNALKYADSSLQLHNTLIDYNTLNASAANPVPVFNTECIFHAVYTLTNTVNLLSKVDSVLYRSYMANDLRRVVFFRVNTDGSYSFKGSYDGSVRFFNGLATDEMYLIKAECLARAGNSVAAVNELNTLLIQRWKTGTFVPYMATDATDALNKILMERRKELLTRCTRWSDLRRLNKEAQFAITIKRVLANQEYFLYPNTPRYVYPIPLEVIQMTGIPQND